jgi:hypothetical protein
VEIQREDNHAETIVELERPLILSPERWGKCLRCSEAGLEHACFGKRNFIGERRFHNTCPRSILPQKLGFPRYLSVRRHPVREIEHRYILEFQCASTSPFEGVVGWSIWNYLILQLCNHDLFVQRFVVAIGALIKSNDAAAPPRDGIAQDDKASLAKMHKEFALIEYGKAIKFAQNALKSTQPRQVLTACLLIFCFEGLLSNRHIALSHVVTGHACLRNWLTKQDRTGSRECSPSSPVPFAVDDELVEAFEYLDLQISTIYDTRSIDTHRTILHDGQSRMRCMPPIFRTMAEARRYLNIAMRQSYHFLATTWPVVNAGALIRDFSGKPPGDITVTTGFNIYSTSYHVPSSIRTEQNEFASYLQKWSEAFDPLYQATQHPENAGTRDHILGTLLRIHAITTEIITAGVLFTEEYSYDVFLPYFREIIALVNIVVDDYRKTSTQKTLACGGFFLGLGITPSLYLLAMRCRDRILRRQAIEVLRGWHPEGCWDSKLIAEMAVFLLEVEEEGIHGDIIPEKSRAVITAICEAPCQYDGKYCALVQCVQRRGTSDGGPVWTERMINYT